MLCVSLLLLLVALLNCSSEPLLFMAQDGRKTHKAWLDPSLSEVVPSLSEVVPSLSEVVPSLSEVDPSLSEVVPSLSEVVPSLSEVVPSLSEVVPSLSKVVPSLSEVVPSLSSSGSAQTLDGPDAAFVPETPMFSEHVNLKWLRFDGALPNGAVAIFNGYAERTDYVCKVNCEAGFYSESKGDFCYYPYADHEYRSSTFDLLVNVDHFEFLEWVEDSHGSAPPFSVRTCSGVDLFVGKNKYGLGKVVTQHEAFFLPWEGDEYWYKSYQVLAINRESYSQHVSHVEYLIDQMQLLHHPPEALQLARVTNLECSSVKKSVRLEKTTAIDKHWDIGRETRNGSTSTMTATVPILGPGNVDFTKEQTVRFSEGTRMSESLSHTVEVEVLVPPNHWCAVRMEGRKMAADLPFKARLSRTDHRGDTRWTSITGTYGGVNLGEINAVVERCQPVSQALPCSPEY